MIADRVNTLQMGVVSLSRIIEILDDGENVEKSGKKNLKLKVESILRMCGLRIMNRSGF